MGIINGGVRTGGGPMRHFGGVGPSAVERAKRAQGGALLNRYVGDASIPQRSGVPIGYLHPVSWSMPLKPGAIALRTFAFADPSVSVAGGVQTILSIASLGVVTIAPVGVTAPGVSIAATLSAAPGASALALLQVAVAGQGVATFELIGAVTGELAVTAALTPAYGPAATATLGLSIAPQSTVTLTLAGAGTLVLGLSSTGSLTAEAIGALLLTMSMSGAATFTSDLSALARLALEIDGGLSVDLQRSANGNLELSISQTSEALSPASVAEAVWSHSTALTLLDAVTLLRQVTDNRLEVDITGQRLVLYDDDAVTVVRTWPLATTGGEPVATAPGVQTRRGAPT